MPVEERREQLRAAALGLIGEQGYQGLTVEAIAAAAGVTKPVLYSAYPTVAELLKDLLDRTQTDALSQLLAAVTGDSMTPSEMTRAWLGIVAEHPRTWAPILRTGSSTPDVVIERIAQGRATVTTALAHALAQAYGGEGMARHRAAAEAFVAAAEHFGRTFVATPEAVDIDVVAELFDDLVRGLRPRHQVRD